MAINYFFFFLSGQYFILIGMYLLWALRWNVLYDRPILKILLKQRYSVRRRK